MPRALPDLGHSFISPLSLSRLALYYKSESAREQFPEFSEGLQQVSGAWRGVVGTGLYQQSSRNKENNFGDEVTYYKVPFPVPVNGLVSDRGLGNRRLTGR